MLQLISREAELSSMILEYARLQRNHHVTAIAILDEIIPDMETHISKLSVGDLFFFSIFEIHPIEKPTKSMYFC